MMNVFVMNKTFNSENSESAAFKWLLTHNKYKKSDRHFYSSRNDFYGIKKIDHTHHQMHDISTMNESQLDSLSDYYDIAYYMDTYGIIQEKKKAKELPKSFVLSKNGGFDLNDIAFLKKMKEKKKLIITEYNLLAPPTSKENRILIENLFGLKWTQWIGSYFSSLDTTNNKELPEWIVQLYKNQHNNQWPFRNAGIVFVHSNQTVVVLENNIDIINESPVLTTFTGEQRRWNLPEKINYLQWFDIMETSDTNNHVISTFQIKTTNKGDSLLSVYRIPPNFPGVIETNNERFYYFCGNFADISEELYLSNLKFIPEIKKMIYPKNSFRSKQSFYWHYYYPIIKKILNNYYQKKP